MQGMQRRLRGGHPTVDAIRSGQELSTARHACVASPGAITTKYAAVLSSHNPSEMLNATLQMAIQGGPSDLRIFSRVIPYLGFP